MKTKFFLFFLLCIRFAEARDTIPFQLYMSINGTYQGTYRTLHSGYKMKGYLRTKSLNDSIFVFSFSTDLDSTDKMRDKDLVFNGNIFSGIARKLVYKGIQTWIGIIDNKSIMMNEKYPFYTSKKYIANSFRSAIDSIGKASDIYYVNNAYHFLRFNFSVNSVSVDNLVQTDRRADEFEQTGSYKRIDEKALIIPSEHAPNIHTKGTIVSKIMVHALPIPDKISNNAILGYLNSNDTVYLNGNYMQYLLIVKYDRNKHIALQGWIERDHVKSIVREEGPE